MSTTTTLSTLKINYLTQAQYDAAVANNEIDEDQIYLTPFINCPYMIGDIYVTRIDYSSTTAGDPSEVWPGTYWRQITDTFLLAAGSTYSSDSGTTAQHGSADAIVPYHRHSIAEQTSKNQSASHNHATNTSGEYFLCVDASPSNAQFAISTSGTRHTVGYASKDHFHGRTTTGNQSASHNHKLAAHNTNYEGTSGNTIGANMPPYLGVFMWERISQPNV